MLWLYHDGEILISAMFAIGKGGICKVRYPGVQLQYFCSLLSYVSLQVLSISCAWCWWAFAVGYVGRRKQKNKSWYGLVCVGR